MFTVAVMVKSEPGNRNTNLYNCSSWSGSCDCVTSRKSGICPRLYLIADQAEGALSKCRSMQQLGGHSFSWNHFLKGSLENHTTPTCVFSTDQAHVMNGVLPYSLAPYLIYRITQFIHQHKSYIGEQTKAQGEKWSFYHLYIISRCWRGFFSVSFHCYLFFSHLSTDKDFRKLSGIIKPCCLILFFWMHLAQESALQSR